MAMEHNAPQTLQGPNGRLAYRKDEGRGPTAIWLGGYASDMLGTKAQALSAAARENGRSFLRFDYTGHGESEGRFEEGTISRWFADAEAVIAHAAKGPKVLIGSSMGAWVALLYALRHPDEVEGLILIAPAPDFTEKLVYPRFSDEQRTVLESDGVLRTGSSGHPAETYTRDLFVDGRQNLIMGDTVPVACPVRILHGLNDEVVPTSHVLELTERIDGTSVRTTLIKGGDHRLSRDEDIALLLDTLKMLAP